MSSRPCRLLLWTVVICWLSADVTSQARAAVYRHLDAQGNVVWSDRPGGTRARVHTPRVLSADSVPSRASPASSPPPAAFIPYQRVRLKPRATPVTLDQARRGISLRLETVPRLRPNDCVQLSVDGKRHQSPLSSHVLVAIGLGAGSHALVAEITDPSGTVRQRSPVLMLEIRPEAAPVSRP